VVANLDEPAHRANATITCRDYSARSRKRSTVVPDCRAGHARCHVIRSIRFNVAFVRSMYFVCVFAVVPISAIAPFPRADEFDVFMDLAIVVVY